MGTPWTSQQLWERCLSYFLRTEHGQEMEEGRSDSGQEIWLIKPHLTEDQGFKQLLLLDIQNFTKLRAQWDFTTGKF